MTFNKEQSKVFNVQPEIIVTIFFFQFKGKTK